jgi:hypothetical protein
MIQNSAWPGSVQVLYQRGVPYWLFHFVLVDISIKYMRDVSDW